MNRPLNNHSSGIFFIFTGFFFLFVGSGMFLLTSYNGSSVDAKQDTAKFSQLKKELETYKKNEGSEKRGEYMRSSDNDVSEVISETETLDEITAEMEKEMNAISRELESLR